MKSLKSWFCKEVEDKKDIELEDMEQSEEEYFKKSAIHETLTSNQEYINIHREWLNIKLNEVQQERINMLDIVRSLVASVKNGTKVRCVCDKDCWTYRTGVYGEFIFCPTCKRTTSESTIKRYMK